MCFIPAAPEPLWPEGTPWLPAGSSLSHEGVRTYAFNGRGVSLRTQVRTYVRTYVRMHFRTYVLTYFIDVHSHMYVRTYVRTCISSLYAHTGYIMNHVHTYVRAYTPRAQRAGFEPAVLHCASPLCGASFYINAAHQYLQGTCGSQPRPRPL